MVPLHLLQRQYKTPLVNRLGKRIRFFRDDYWYYRPYEKIRDYKARPLTGEYTEFPRDGYILTVREFLKLTKTSKLVNSDGYGHPVRGNRFDPNIHIIPSHNGDDIPRDATHIEWYPANGD